MDRVGQVWRIRPGKRDEYIRRHATVWPEMDDLLRSCGVRSYTIYAWGEVVFAHLEVDDYARLVERYNADPVAQRWETEFGELIENVGGDPETGWPERLPEVWSL